ncbi:hypothetical protein DFJ63DRAFT_175957 [Scheffersomyces coipomensis]|uniref:uncharacterized protein n=1 Tax=Scheffersomyces coipomensis TaxID=1788519 RepID=UPI00315CF23D
MYLRTLVAILLCIVRVLAKTTTSTTKVETPTTTSLDPTETPSTIIDILSSQAQYSYFLRHLQRNGMVPIINSLHDITLLAPVNSAFSSLEAIKQLDNNQLLRYIVNQKFRVGYLDDNEVYFNTLYRMSAEKNYSISIIPDFETFEYVVDNVSAIIDPDIYAKHQHSFIQGIEHLLPQKSTICDILLDDSTYQLDGQNISFIKQLFQSIFLDEEEFFIEGKKKKKKKEYKPPKEVFPDTCESFFSNTRSLLIPSDEFINDSLTEIERRYYLSSFHSLNSTKFSTTDEAFLEVKTDIFSLLRHIMLKDLVYGTNGTATKKSHESLAEDSKYKIHLNQTSIIINDKLTSSTSYLASDGVVHIFNNEATTKVSKDNSKFFQALNIPTVDIIPRKALYALHFSNFVKELNFRSLDYLIDGSVANQTLFIERDQKDDIEEDDDNDDGESVNVYSFSSKQNLLYQFADEPVDLTTVEAESDGNHQLLNSKLCSKKRVGGCFKLKLSVSNIKGENVTTLNDDIGVIDIPMPLGNNSFVYVTDSEITSPVSFKHSVGDLMSDGAIHRHLEHIKIDQKTCLTTLQYLNDFDMYSLNENGKGYSVFLPCGRNIKNSKGSWKDLGLILNYLEANPLLFKDLLKGMFIEDTIYSNFGLNHKDRQMVHSSNLNGDLVNIENYQYDGGFNHMIRLNNTKVSLPINSDILFNQGVIHIINEVLLPESFSIPFADLAKTTMDMNYPDYSIVNLIEMFPKLSKALGFHGEAHSTNQYSLLIPSPESLKDFNITTSFTKLYDFLELHLIPNKEIGNLIDCINDNSPQLNSTGYVVNTNLTNATMVCIRDHKNDKVYLQLHKLNNHNSSDFNALSYNKDHEVRLLNHGCTSLNQSSASCVFLIEKPLNLKWIEDPDDDNFLHIHLGFISVGVGIILGLAMFGMVMLGAIYCLGNNRRKFGEPLSQYDNDSMFPRSESTFMPVLTDDDSEDFDRGFDIGYETDLDMLRTETESLLPLHGKRKKRGKKRDYGSTANGEATSPSGPINITGHVSAPRNIHNKSISHTLGRERNIPGFGP